MIEDPSEPYHIMSEYVLFLPVNKTESDDYNSQTDVGIL